MNLRIASFVPEAIKKLAIAKIEMIVAYRPYSIGPRIRTNIGVNNSPMISMENLPITLDITPEVNDLDTTRKSIARIKDFPIPAYVYIQDLHTRLANVMWRVVVT